MNISFKPLRMPQIQNGFLLWNREYFPKLGRHRCGISSGSIWPDDILPFPMTALVIGLDITSLDGRTANTVATGAWHGALLNAFCSFAQCCLRGTLSSLWTIFCVVCYIFNTCRPNWITNKIRWLLKIEIEYNKWKILPLTPKFPFKF